jgi:hypothetical protein
VRKVNKGEGGEDRKRRGEGKVRTSTVSIPCPVVDLSATMREHFYVVNTVSRLRS